MLLSIGPLRIAHGIKSKLQQGSKFGVLPSGMGSISDKNSGGIYSYAMSKNVSFIKICFIKQ